MLFLWEGEEDDEVVVPDMLLHFVADLKVEIRRLRMISGEEEDMCVLFLWEGEEQMAEEEKSVIPMGRGRGSGLRSHSTRPCGAA